MNAIKYALLGLVGVVGLLLSTFGPFKIPFAEGLAKAYYRYAIAGMLVVIMLLGGVIAVAVHVLDPNQFKAQIVHWVQERTQRELLLEGELKLSYFPKLGFETGKASLSQRRSAREFAAIDSARVTIAWLPLLHRKVLIDRAEVDGLRAHLVRFKDGSTNADDLWRHIATVSPASIDVDGVKLSRSTIQWNDEVEWQRGSLNEVQIEIGRLADGLPAAMIASARIDAPNTGIDARLQLKGRLLFDVNAGRVELAGLDGQLEGKALGIDNLSLGIRGDVTALPGERSASIENVVVTSASKSGLSVFNARIATPELKFSEQRFSGAQLSFDASLAHPDRTTTAALQVPRFEWSERALRGASANAQLSVRGAGTQLRMQLSSPVALHLDAGPRLELDAIEMTSTGQHPALAAELPASASGKLEIDARQQTARLVLAGKLAGNDVKGEIALAAFDRPRWTVQLDAAHVDLDALLSKPWLARWSDASTPFDMSALRELSLHGQMKAQSIKWGGLQLSDVAAQFEADRSALRIEPITANAYGGALEASVHVGASGAPRIAAKGMLSEFDVRGLLADVTPAVWLQGHGGLAWDLSAEGGSVGTLRNGLAGPLTLALHGGALSGIDLRAALFEGRGEIGKRAAAQQREFNPSASTPFSDMKARFELREGRAHAQSLELNAAAIRAAGDGVVALDGDGLDLDLLATVARGAQDLAALAGVSVPMKVRGPWREPRFALDFGAATGGAVPRPGDGAADAPVASPSGPPLPALGEPVIAALKRR